MLLITETTDEQLIEMYKEIREINEGADGVLLAKTIIYGTESMPKLLGADNGEIFHFVLGMLMSVHYPSLTGEIVEAYMQKGVLSVAFKSVLQSVVSDIDRMYRLTR